MWLLLLNFGWLVIELLVRIVMLLELVRYRKLGWLVCEIWLKPGRDHCQLTAVVRCMGVPTQGY